MVWYRHIYIFFFFVLITSAVQAQYFRFSDDPDRFVLDVAAHLNSLDTEPARKVAYDFKTVWSGQLTDNQKVAIISVCQQLDKRKLWFHPYFEHFFSMITYSLTQEGANKEEFDNLLLVCQHAADNYSKEELRTFLRSLTYFFARGALYNSHYNKVSTTGGSYKIKLLEEAEPITNAYEIIEEEEEPEMADGEEDFISDEEISEDYETIDDGSADDWGDDSWDDNNDNGWGTDDDSWGDDDGWGSESTDDGWGDESEEESAPIKEKKAPKKIVRQTFSYEKIDYVSGVKSEDIDPQIGGPVLELSNFDFKIETPYDTLIIKNATGTFMLRSQIFVGTAGEISWPHKHRGTEGAVVHLEGYNFKVNVPKLRTTRAKLEYPDLFAGQVEGVFSFKSGLRKRSAEITQPQFISHQADIELFLPGERLKYVGGFAMKGSRKYGTSVSRELSKIEVTDGKGRSFKSQALKYVFKDSIIYSSNSALVLHHGKDSIYHPAVQFDFDASQNKLMLLKDRGDFKHTYYFSSFFKLEFKADMLEWAMDGDSIDISIMNAKNRIPAVFESEEYFNPIRFEKMTGLFKFHPVMVVVRFARLIQSSEYNVLEIQDYMNIDPDLATAAMRYLKQNGYILFDEDNGKIKVLRKSFHYVLSNTKLKDYDNILISSIYANGPNATLNLETGEMDVRGVRKIFVTPDQDVHITPKNKIVTLLQDKDMKFDGIINAGDFQYDGHDFLFDYDEYLIVMDSIDSIRIQIDFHEEENVHKTSLQNHLTKTSGTLYINNPKNKAGLREFVQYPFFVSESKAIVYFDSPEILGGAYDRSMFFIVPPFEMDSIDRDNPEGISFIGTFHSGGILPPFQDTLVVMPDKSLGFNHVIPQEGYALYGGEGVLYDSLSLSNKGLRANGRIDYRTTTVHSEDFVFYMDSVSAIGHEGIMREGVIGDATYPEAALVDYKMLWLPLKDSMYIENKGAPFQFYNSTASLDGKANITAGGVFGSGEMLSRGSISNSQEFHFSQYEYSGRHAKFQVLSDNPEKPAMEGDDIALLFDLVSNIADVKPEIQGVAAISFPYAQMKTSITEAVWYLDSSKITMTKPDLVDINSTYFYTTRADLDSLAFNASGATYDMNTYELKITGIPFIKVADAEIIPDNNETTILENSVLQPFNNARMKIDTLNGYHSLFDGNITILSRREFQGYATYELINAEQDTFAIKFESFELRPVLTRTNEYETMTVSEGIILESQHVAVSSGFHYSGDVTMYATRKKLAMEGQIRPDIKSLGSYDYWIDYQTAGDSAEVAINMNTAVTTEGQPVVAGILRGYITSDIYMAYVRDKDREQDTYFFKAEGLLTYDPVSTDFRIEAPKKTSNESYAGKSFIYNDVLKELIFEGSVDFINNKEEFNMTSTVVGLAKPDSNYYFMDAMIGINMDIHPQLLLSMGDDLSEMIAQIGPDVAHSNNIEMMYKLAGIIGDDATKYYENNSMKGYIPLYESDPSLIKTLFISNVDLIWSDKYRAFYNTSKIGLSHLYRYDINALSDGFIEIKKDADGADEVHLFFQLAPATWYYFSYIQGRLLMYSSNSDFNDLVLERSTVDKTGFGEYTTVLGDEFEVLKFVNEFRSNYYGIQDEYDLEFPDDTHLEEDNFDTFEDGDENEESGTGFTPVDDTLEEDEDDGF